jgi:hypothetical protein
VSGDALQDIGILTNFAKSKGYNAIFLTDHTATSVHEIGGVVANNVLFDDDLKQWGASATGGDAAAFDTAGTVASRTGVLVTTPVLSGTKSLHMSVSSPTYGEEFIDSRRGPNLRASSILLSFSLFPTRIDPGSGAYVSVSLGGDPTIPSRPPNGYTTAAGVISPGKTTILVWQVGKPRVPSTDPAARVLTRALPYTLNRWNSYVIDVRSGAVTWNGAAAGTGAGLDAIPAADQPVDYEALTQLKLAIGAANGGTADAYFDAYSLSVPKTPPWETSASLFVYRNSIAHQYDTPDFKVFPGHEMGYSDHAMDFDYDISDPSQFQIFSHGTDGIATAQAKGYPSQLNHPGLPGGVTQQDAIDNNAYGADLMEVAERGEEGYIKDVMVQTWDAILSKGVMLVGTWTSDAHRTEKFGPVTYIWAPDLTFNSLTRSLYEGRMFLANNDFPGQVFFNSAERTTSDPYPARYPIWVAGGAGLASVHLQITGGVPAGGKVLWVENGQTVLTDTPSGTSFETTRSFPFNAPFSYIRAELRDAAGHRIAMTEPIFFRPSNLPAGMSARTTGVTTTSGAGYTRLAVGGLGQPVWDSTARTVTLPITDPQGALAEIELHTGSFDASAMSVGGVAARMVTSLADWDAATDSAWFYDAPGHLLRVKVVQGAGATTAVVTFSPGTDTTPPTAPAALTASATGTDRVALRWTAATDNVAVKGYTVYRDGVAIKMTGASTLTYTDVGLSPGHFYTYRVDAFDASANHSALSPAAPAKTDTRLTFVFPAAADTYVSDAAPATNYGTAQTLRMDGSPVVRTFVRFAAGSISGTVEQVLLRVVATSSGAGFQAHVVSDTAWDERAVTWSTQPSFLAAVAGSTLGFLTGATVDTDVTSSYAAGAAVSFALTTDNTAAMSVSSREGANAPQLVVETRMPNRAPTAGAVTLAAAPGATTPWKPVAADPDGDAVTCRIAAASPHGIATVASDCTGGTYTPSPGYTGPDQFTYAVSDGVLSTVATVTVTVG